MNTSRLFELMICDTTEIDTALLKDLKFCIDDHKKILPFLFNIADRNVGPVIITHFICIALFRMLRHFTYIH